MPTLFEDNDDCPDDRGDDVPCENCGESWGHHDGWCCPPHTDGRSRKYELEPHERYLTKDMNDYCNGDDDESQAFLLMAAGVVARARYEPVH